MPDVTIEEAIAQRSSAWRADEEARQRAELEEVDQEIDSLNKAIANLQSQLEALTSLKSDIQTRLEALPGQELARAHEAVFQTLLAQAEQVAARAAEVTAAEKARQAKLPESLKKSEVAELVTEYRQFKEQVAPTLEALPESYRSVIVHHHQGVAAKLRDHVNALMAGPVEVEGAAHEVEVVYAIDRYEGAAELLVAVLPIDEATWTGWRERDEDLQTWMAARVVQALHQASQQASWPIHAAYGGFRGLLTIEVVIEEAPDELVGAFETQLGEVLSRAPEFKAAQLAVSAREVPFDYLLPPDDETQAVSPVPVSADAEEATDAG